MLLAKSKVTDRRTNRQQDIQTLNFNSCALIFDPAAFPHKSVL